MGWKDLVKKAAEKANELKDKAIEKTPEIIQKANELKDKAKEKAISVVPAIVEGVEKAHTFLDKTVDDAFNKAVDIKDVAAEKTKKGALIEPFIPGAQQTPKPEDKAQKKTPVKKNGVKKKGPKKG